VKYILYAISTYMFRPLTQRSSVTQYKGLRLKEDKNVLSDRNNPSNKIKMQNS